MNRVLVLTNSISGLYSFRRELIEKLKDIGYEVTIVAPKDKKTSYFTNIGCDCIETPINRRGTNPISDFKLLFSYLKTIRSIKPNIVLTYTIKPNVYGGIVCNFLKIPYIANITGLGSAVENKGILQKITLFLYRISINKANCVFFQNEENKNFMLNSNIARYNHRLIPGSGVNLEHYQYLEYPKDNTINFLFISRIMKEKGIDQYLEAAEYIKGKYPNTVFHILGACEEPHYKKVLTDMEERRVILYHGKQKDVREYHKISNCTIHPSYYPEGMSNVLLESAACGRPIITTDRSGCREIVNLGNNGYLIKQKNTKDLIEAVEKFLELNNNEKKAMGLAGRMKVEKEFSRKIVIEAYLNEIEKTLGRKMDGI